MSKILHRQFLNNKEILNLCLKKINNKSSYLIQNNNENIFITGLARSGTTALLQSIDNTKIFGSFRYKYMPFILYPKLAEIFSKLSSKNESIQIERIHNDGILIGSNSPECLDEIYWINKSCREFILNNELKPHNISEADLKDYAYLINEYLKIEHKKRFLIKNNNSHMRIIKLSKFFSKSIFLVMFRNPITHANSLLNLHRKLIKIQQKDKFVLEYMNLIGHWEFGLNKKPFIYINYQRDILLNLNSNSIEYWLNQWLFTYEWILEILIKNKDDIKNIKLVCYEELCKNTSYKNNLYRSINISDNKNDFKFIIGKSNSSSENINKKLLSKTIGIYEKLRELSFEFL